jgi:caffeoyl-CoA O-methyltransferase
VRELLAPEVGAYLDGLVPPRPPEMLGMEAYAERTRFPIIGPATGALCRQLARMIGARKVFELGSGFGYSTAWFCQAVREVGGGEVHHTVWDEDLSAEAREHLEALGYEDLVQYHVGEAVGTLADIDDTFDLVFLDIDKEGYPGALPVIADRLRSGGLLLVDNALWSGRVLDTGDDSPATEGVREMTRMLTTDERWLVSVAPIRDGLLIALRT